MRRPARRHVLLGIAWTVALYPVLDYLYWHHKGGVFNHSR